MRRDQLELDVTHAAWVEDGDVPAKPEVHITPVDDAAGRELRQRLTDPDGDLLDAEETDVSFRLLGTLDGDAAGVVSVTNRLTGDFVLELNEDAEDVLQFVSAARRYGEQEGDDGRYVVTIELADESVTYEKTTFLVYNGDGELLRDRSLIPGGVEL